MESYSSREVLRKLYENGWRDYACDGDHLQLKHPLKPGKVTVPHPVKDIPIRTLKSIERQSGVQFD